MSEILRILRSLEPRDIFDILVVSSLFYVVLRLMRGERASVPQRGFLVAAFLSVFVYVMAVLLQLQTLTYLFERLWLLMLLLAVVIFQSDLRRGLAELGRIRLVRSLFTRPDVGLSELVKSAQEMSSRRIGALIAIERSLPLRTWIERGTPLEALIRSETIRTIFTTPAPLHDGALIVQGDRLAAAGCILPLTHDETLSQELGTRHRAALGLAEETDAAVVVVSEETGKISLAAEGKLERDLDAHTLQKRLNDLMGVTSDED